MNKKPVAIVTGGARGIGAATVKLFVQQGFQVCFSFLTNKSAAAALETEIGKHCVGIQADVSSEDGIKSLFGYVDSHFGRLDVLVNNVGILQQQSSLLEMDAQRINHILRTNVTSQFMCAKQAVKRMSTNHNGIGGSIVNVSSTAALSGAPNEYVDYAASKGAIDTFTKGLAMEVAKQGIRVNGVRPALIYTDIHVLSGDKDRVDKLVNKVPMGRGGKPEEVAEAMYTQTTWKYRVQWELNSF